MDDQLTLHSLIFNSKNFYQAFNASFAACLVMHSRLFVQFFASLTFWQALLKNSA